MQDLFAPLANRLGVWQQSGSSRISPLRALEPAAYKSIAAMLDERRTDRERYIEGVIATLRDEPAAAGLRAEVRGRPKHIYSIWNKMRRKEVGIEALHDIRAVRVLCRTCATVTRCSASSITCGRRYPVNSTTTSRSRRRTVTGRCTPRS
jgi:GTP pyrophosphokinase